MYVFSRLLSCLPCVHYYLLVSWQVDVLQEQEYERFELSLKTDNNDYDETEKETVKWIVGTNAYCKTVAKDQEVRIGIKDWLVNYHSFLAPNICSIIYSL